MALKLVYTIILCIGLLSTNYAITNPAQIRRVCYSFITFLRTNDSIPQQKTHQYDVFYYKDIIMYRLEYGFVATKDGETLQNEKRHYYFVYQKDSVAGYYYYPDADLDYPNEDFARMNKKRCSVDTALNSFIRKTNSFDTLSTLRPDSIYTDAEKNLVRVYINPYKMDTVNKGSIYLYYSRQFKAKNPPFFEQLDNVHRKKLWKIRAVASEEGSYKKKNKSAFISEVMWEMKEAPVENPSEIMLYFTKYERAVANAN